MLDIQETGTTFDYLNEKNKKGSTFISPQQ
jgi:hypothetical protein